MPQEVAHVTGRARCVHRDPDRADPREREVDERPFQAVAREQRDVVALAYAAREEPVRILDHALVRLFPGDLLPPVGGLDQVRGVRAPCRDCIDPELRDRTPTGFRRGLDTHLDRLGHCLSLAGEGFSVPGRIRLVLRQKWIVALTVEYAFTHANYLERIPELRPRLDSRRPGAGDEAGRAAVGRLIPA